MTEEIFEHCHLCELPVRGDERGRLVAIEGGKEVPFDIARIYYIYGTEPGTPRGFHAHHSLRQYAICVSGSCLMRVDNGRDRRDLRLDRPDLALYLGPMIWHEMRDLSPDCVLLVIADGPYDEADYIRDYGEFAALVSGRGS
jgi:dTDP-4-dehydrorhamnose 3,5-epimerase-like enzyme